MSFKDYYSKQANEYSKCRPTYPAELFQFLNSVAANHELAVDCATGSGQAALGLSNYFKKVIAFDASQAQIKNAFQRSNIEYKIAKAEDTNIPGCSADLVTIATAIHWVDKDLFYNEVKRILKDDGVIAVWTYNTTTMISPQIDEAVNSFAENVLNVHWDRAIEQIWSFEDMNFPFKKIASPEFEIKKNWTYEEYLNYLYTWSSVHKYIEVLNANPLDLFKEDLRKVWGDSKRDVCWKIQMKTGIKEGDKNLNKS